MARNEDDVRMEPGAFRRRRLFTMKPFRKPIRLDPEAYRIGHCFSVTIRTSFHRRLFASGATVNIALASLRDSTGNFRARVYAYCFMPDHAHLLAHAPPGADFLEFVDHFKQLSGYRIRLETSDRRPVWQPRFYDHALRSTEGILPTMRLSSPTPSEQASSRTLTSTRTADRWNGPTS